MKGWIVASLLLLATPAAADIWSWTEATGEQHFTDDPGSVPPARVHTLRRVDGLDEDDSFSTREEGAARATENEVARTLLGMELRRLLEEHATAAAELERLRIELSEASRESRKWKAGGRIGAADRAALADRRVETLRRDVDARERRLADLEAKIKRLGRP